MAISFMGLSAASCGNSSNNNASVTGTAATDITKASEAGEVLDVDAVLANADDLAGKQINIEAICTHLCAHGATKMFLMGSDDGKTIRVEAAKLGSFSRQCANSIVNVKGIVREERVDEAYLQEWEKAVAAAGLQHGEGEGGCDSEKAARGETGNTVAERIANFRTKIAEREKAEGKAYLSFYYVEALDYAIVE